VSEPACPRCGLVFSRWTPGPDAPEAAPHLDEEAEALWAAAVASWTDVDRHEVFLKHCSRAGLLGPAGRRYRERVDQQPMDPIAAQMQSRVLAMATAGFIRPAAMPTPVTRSTWFWAIMVVCGVAAAGAALFLRR
jgi:hypothetical protein